MIFVRQDGVHALGPTAQPYQFYVDVCDKRGNPAFRDSNKGEIRQEVLDWCDKNCSMPALIGGLEMVCFQTEDDALLFYLRFKR